MNIKTIIIDYNNAAQANDLITLLSTFALDPMSGSTELPEYTKANLIQALANTPHALSIICYKDDIPVGFTNCFYGFSTFKCKPLINIHDLMVCHKYRGQGIGNILLEKVEEVAILSNCCKITLEALEHNVVARQAYQKFGFTKYELDPKLGPALFFEKEINPTFLKN